jgi:hypothetical protein
MKKIFLFLLILLTCCNQAYANDVVSDVEITRLGSYQNSDIHYVWVSSGVVPACQTANPGNPTLFFSEKAIGGKSLLAVFLLAVTTKKKVDLQVNGCEIVEVYYR